MSPREKTPKPTCRFCGKPLRRYKLRDVAEFKARGMEWGDYGDNKFCGLRCGYEWAITVSRSFPTIVITHKPKEPAAGG